MPTNAQITANRANAQQSTGPITEAGKQRASQNSIKHGFTGQSLIVTPVEKEAYEAHVQAYFDHHKPTTHKHRELVQQLADLHWSVHQIFVQQNNVLSLMNAITVQACEQGDPIATAAALAPVARTLNTLNIYETRRRRAAQAVQQQLETLEAELAEQAAAARRAPTTQPTPIGSVYSTPVQDAELDALIRHLESQETPETVARIRREAGLKA